MKKVRQYTNLWTEFEDKHSYEIVISFDELRYRYMAEFVMVCRELC